MRWESKPPQNPQNTPAEAEPHPDGPLRPPPRKKAKKRQNQYKPPSRPPPPGIDVSLKGKAIRLPLIQGKDDPLIDDRGFPDRQIDYDFLEEKECAPLLRKTVSELPKDIDPDFNVQFDEAKHGAYLREHLKTGEMPPKILQRLTNLIKKYWCVFNPDGVKYTVIGYECDIDTGDAAPISCGNVNYGARESKIMDKHIAALVDMTHAYGIPHSAWMFKGLLAPKPHQTTCYDILNFKWRFCVNYIRLNQVTLVLVFPIPWCDNACMYEFGDGRLY